MKQKSIAKKMSITRSKRFKEDLTFKKQASGLMKKAWAKGLFDGVQTGRCKWYDYTSKNGINYKLQGTWELAYAKWLDENNINFKSHIHRIPYIQNDIEHNYYPDFYLSDEKLYVEIKNIYHHSLNPEKFELIRAQNKDINIKLLFKKDLQKLGIKL